MKTAKKDRRRPRKEKEKKIKKIYLKKKMKSKSRKRELSKKKQRGGAEKPEMIGRIQSNLITMLMKPQIKFFCRHRVVWKIIWKMKKRI